MKPFIAPNIWYIEFQARHLNQAVHLHWFNFCDWPSMIDNLGTDWKPAAAGSRIFYEKIVVVFSKKSCYYKIRERATGGYRILHH